MYLLEKALAEKKLRNEKANRGQFEWYEKVLGDRASKTLDCFRKVKYTDVEEWKYLTIRLLLLML